MPATNSVNRKVISVKRKYFTRLESFGSNYERCIREVHRAIGVHSRVFEDEAME
jgi:hypothetical protein